MYERFTDRARRTMQLANQEACKWGDEYVGDIHILYGILRENGVAAEMLKRMGDRSLLIATELNKAFLSSHSVGTPVSGKLPHSPRAKKVVEFAIDEARTSGHNYVGTENLLLGVLRLEDGTAFGILKQFGITLDRARQAMADFLGDVQKPKAVAGFCDEGGVTSGVWSISTTVVDHRHVEHLTAELAAAKKDNAILEKQVVELGRKWHDASEELERLRNQSATSESERIAELERQIALRDKAIIEIALLRVR